MTYPMFFKHLRHLAGENRCLLLTALLLLFLLGQPLATGKATNNLLMLGYYLTMLFAPYFISRRKLVLKLTLIAGLVLLLPKILLLFHGDRTTQELLNHLILWNSTLIVLIVFELLLTGCVLYYSLNANNREPVCACVLTFLLIGLCFADFYYLIDRMIPGSFTLGGEVLLNPTLPLFQYFSFITLTTTGFGDVVPMHPFMRELAALEAVVGVLYVALFIGRIIHIGIKPGKDTK